MVVLSTNSLYTVTLHTKIGKLVLNFIKIFPLPLKSRTKIHVRLEVIHPVFLTDQMHCDPGFLHKNCFLWCVCQLLKFNSSFFITLFLKKICLKQEEKVLKSFNKRKEWTFTSISISYTLNKSETMNLNIKYLKLHFLAILMLNSIYLTNNKLEFMEL